MLQIYANGELDSSLHALPGLTERRSLYFSEEVSAGCDHTCRLILGLPFEVASRLVATGELKHYVLCVRCALDGPASPYAEDSGPPSGGQGAAGGADGGLSEALAYLASVHEQTPLEVISLIAFNAMAGALDGHHPSKDTGARVARLLHAAASDAHVGHESGGPTKANCLAVRSMLDAHRTQRTGGNNGVLTDSANVMMRQGSTHSDSRLPRQTGHFWLVNYVDDHKRWVAGVPTYISPDERRGVHLSKCRANPFRGVVSVLPHIAASASLFGLPF